MTGAHYLIRKGGYFYRPNAQGYTQKIDEAGLFTLERAKSEHANRPDEVHYLHIREAEGELREEARRLVGRFNSIRNLLATLANPDLPQPIFVLPDPDGVPFTIVQGGLAASDLNKPDSVVGE